MALWTVVILLAVLVVVNSVAVIALTRQVGLLHLRTGLQRDQHDRQPPRGPQPGTRLRLDPRDVMGSGPAPGLILLGFVRPACVGCTAALPAFASVASGLPGSERVLLVSDADEAVTRDYLAAHGVSLPLAAGPHLLSANGIPAVPYAVIADGEGTVLAAETAGSAEHLAALLSRARHYTQAEAR
jgi:hypothetical protein